MKERIKNSICVLTVFIFLVVSAYINTYYRALEITLPMVEQAEKLNKDTLAFVPEGEIKAGFIFYPGGKVEYTAYASLMKDCADNGILCILLKMPCNLAVLDIDAAKGIQELYPEVATWYMGGHSLGGSMAASYIGEHEEEFEGLILLASYSTEDLSDSELKVLSIYGTEDQVLDKEKYLKYKLNLPEDYSEVIIDGGCHAYFGSYGEQKGDGEAVISVEEQQIETIHAITEFVK